MKNISLLFLLYEVVAEEENREQQQQKKQNNFCLSLMRDLVCVPVLKVVNAISLGKNGTVELIFKITAPYSTKNTSLHK